MKTILLSFLIMMICSSIGTAQQEDASQALRKDEINLHHLAKNGLLDSSGLKQFLTDYYGRQVKLSITPDDTGNVTEAMIAAAKLKRNKTINDYVAERYQALYVQGTPTGDYYREHGFFKETSIADLVLADPSYNPVTLNANPVKPTIDYEATQVYVTARKSSGLLDSNFNVSPDKTSGKMVLDNGPQDSGALLSYNRNFATDKNTWTAQGSVGLPVRFPQSSSLGLQEAWIVPSIDFNHLGGSAVLTKNRLDSLNFNLGTLLRFGFSDGSALSLRVAEINETDFNFSSLIVGGETEVEYKNPSIGWGAPNVIASNADDVAYAYFFPRAILKCDGGSVLDAGEKTTLVDGEDYSRLGPTISLNVYAGEAVSPDIKKYLPIVQFNYGHFVGLIGKTYDDYNTLAKWNLDGKGVVSMTISYDHGGLNQNGDKANQITFGLTLKN